MSLKEFNDYDVLLILPSNNSTSDEEREEPSKTKKEEEEDSKKEEQSLSVIQFATSNHVGNNRFNILLNLHRETYKTALLKEEEEEKEEESKDTEDKKKEERTTTTTCDDIVKKLVNTICHECVPKGRLLKKDNNNKSYRDLGHGEEAAKIVKMALLQDVIEVAVASEEDTADTTTTTTRTDDLDVVDYQSDDDGTIDGFMADYFVNLMSSPTNNNYNSNNNSSEDDKSSSENKKRRRKSSLLRRSVTDMGVKLSAQKSKYKVSFRRRISSLFRAGIADITNYDVLCDCNTDEYGVHRILTPTSYFQGNNNSSSSTAATNHVGNTRLHIMTDLRREKYQQAISSQNSTERSNVIHDIIRTVHQTCSGRFLIQDTTTSLYYEMSYERAMASVETLLMWSSSSSTMPSPPPPSFSESFEIVPPQTVLSSSSSVPTVTQPIIPQTKLSTSSSVPEVLPQQRPVLSTSFNTPLPLPQHTTTTTTTTQKRPSDSNTATSSSSSSSITSLPPPPPVTTSRRSSEVTKLRSAAIQSLLRKKQIKDVVDRHRQKVKNMYV